MIRPYSQGCYLNSQEAIERLIEAGGGMEAIEGWFSARTFRVERNARAAVEDWGNTLFDCLSELAKNGATGDQQKEWNDRFIRKWLAYQHAAARTMNWMITGPANFPVAQNEKRMASERKRYEELTYFVENRLNWLRRRERSAERAALSEKAADETFEEREVAGVRLVKNTVLDRVQLIFPGKPDDETRADLKRSAFRWSPREGAWQRKLTRNGLWAAEGILAAIASDQSQEGQ